MPYWHLNKVSCNAQKEMNGHMSPNVPRVQCGWLSVQPVSGRTAAGCSHQPPPASSHCEEISSLVQDPGHAAAADGNSIFK